MNPKRPTPKYIIINMPKVKDKVKILKAAREKQLVTYKGAPIRLSADLSIETLQAKRNWQKNIKSDEKQGPTSTVALFSKNYHLESKHR